MRWRSRKTRGFARRALAAVARLGLLAVLVSVGMVGCLRVVDPPASAFMLGRMLEAQRAGRASFAVRRRWVPLRELPEHVPLAVLSSEDQRFFQHAGFDTEELSNAVRDHLAGEPLRGASTITQQVAKNLFLWEARSLTRKALEAYFTWVLELLWPKHRILEVYLNIAEMGDGVFGVGAAARHHFHCNARALSRQQAALLAAILPAPRSRSVRAPSPRVRRKQRWILRQMPIVRGLQPPLTAGIDRVRTRATSTSHPW